VCGFIGGTASRADLMFTFDYSGNTAGVGFLDPLDGAARQTALTTAGNLFSNLYGSHFSNMGTITLAVTSTNDNTLDTLASAGSNFENSPGTFGGGEVIRNKLVNGIDLNGASHDGYVDVNWGYEWELDPNIPAVVPGAGQTFDFYAAVFHEFTHALGFGSEISSTPGSDRFGQGEDGSGNPGSWSKWDEFLQDGNGNTLVHSGNFEVNQPAFADAQANGGVFAGPNAVAAYGGVVPLFPNSDQSHLDEVTFSMPNMSNNFMMKPERDYGPQEARTWSSLEVAILRDLGYTAVPEPSSIVLLAVGMLGVCLRRRNRMSTKTLSE